MDNEKNKLVNFPNARRHSVRDYYDNPDDEYETEIDDDFDDESLEEYEDENPFEEDFSEDYEEESGASSGFQKKKKKKSDEEESTKEEKQKKDSKPKQKQKSKQKPQKQINKNAKGELKSKVIKAITSFITKHPVVFIVIIAVLLIFLLSVVFLLLLSGESSSGSNNITSQGNSITGATCDYNLGGINDETVVQLINCESTIDSYTVLETMPLEKYVAGVAIAEMGEDYHPEAMKAQLIAVRSFTLTRNVPEYNVGFDKRDNVIRMRACENDQVYWDYDKDIYRSAGAVSENVSKYSPEYTPQEGETPWKKALSAEKKAQYEKIVEEVLGKYAVDSNGKVVATGYINTTTEQFDTFARSFAGTDNGKYTGILMNTYDNISSIETTSCSLNYYGDAGEYSTWKQNASLGAPWAEVKIGTTATIDSAGCLITSIAMQIAHSGIPTGNIKDFNPGTFATALKNNNILSDSGAINSYSNINKVIPGFKYAGGNNWTKYNIAISRRYERIKEVTEDGYYTVIEVKKHRGGQHWVALDVQNSANANWEEIYIWDPASTKTTISDADRYQVNRIVYFKLENGG